MKKLLVLSVLLGLLVLPVFAEHVSIDMGGDSTFGFIGDFGDAEAEDTDLTWDVIVGIDDYNSFTWSLKGLDDILVGPLALDKALVTTDVGMWLGLPVGFHINWGYDDPDANEFAVVTGYENEQVYDLSPAEYWGFDFLISYSIIEVELAFDPGIAGTWGPAIGPFPPTGDQGSILAGLALKEPVPGMNAEVYYFQGGDVATDVYDMGLIAFGTSYATEVAGIGLDAGASFLLDLDDAAADGWAFGVGVAAAVSMFDITVGLNGNETDAVSHITASVDVAAHDMAAIYAGVDLDLEDLAPETLAGADIGVNAHIGLVEAYLGYLITTVGGGDYNAPATLTDGGMYIKFDVDY